MKKIYVQAYLNHNLGDDLFVRYLANRYSNTRFFVNADLEYKEAFKDVRNIRIIPSYTKYKNIIIRKLLVKIDNYYKKKSHMIIYIGGSIFMEFPTWKNMIVWYKHLFETNRTYVIGANFGPFKTVEYKNEMESVFKKLPDLCFRDNYSYNLFKHLPNIRCAPDILFSFPYEKENNKNNQKKVFISVIDIESRDAFPNNLIGFMSNYEQSILKIIDIYYKKGYKVILSSFCKNENDEVFIDKILNSVSSAQRGNLHVMNYNGANWHLILKEISSSNYVIATRFHCTIFALCCQVPVLPLIYSDKTKNVLNDLGFKGKYWDIRDNSFELDNDFIEYNELNDIVLTDFDLENIRKESLRHFEKIDIELSRKE